MKQICLIICYAAAVFGYSASENVCNKSPSSCTDSKYRTIDGSCNNLKKPYLGKSNRPYGRLTKVTYSDGKHNLPVMNSGKPYPSARVVSNLVFLPGNVTDENYTLTAMQVGQLIAHDMSLAIDTRTAAPPPDCCTSTFQFGPDSGTNSCADINIPPNDPNYSKAGYKCRQFVRAGTTSDYGCPYAKYEEQVTIITAFLDLSYIYGNTDEENAMLRTFKDGKLKTTTRNGENFPVESSDRALKCPQAQTTTEPCYLFGDVRANQNPQLTALHILLYNEHNRIASEVKAKTSLKDDETIFQEARRINIAQMQHIYYNEIIPVYIGKDRMIEKKLIYPDAEDCVDDYDENEDPSVLHEFASGAFRHFHSMLVGTLKTYNANGEYLDYIRLSDYIDRAAALELSKSVNYDTLMKGLTVQPSAKSDDFVDAEVKSRFGKNYTNNLGDDLVSTDIQRARDYGLARYVDVRKLCNLSVPNSFDDLLQDIDLSDVSKLKQLYETIDDVEYFVAGRVEKPLSNSMVGPTFMCIILKQFKNTRKADRYFYQNCEKGQFNRDQLSSIRDATLARIICDNTFVKKIQRRVAEPIGKNNPLVSCDDIESIDITLFK